MKNVERNIDVDSNHASDLNAGTIIIGIIVDIDDQGRPLIDYNNNPVNSPVVAITTQFITKSHISRQVALLFNNGDLTQPVIMGIIQNPLNELLENFELTSTPIPGSDSEDVNQSIDPDQSIENVTVDGKRVVIEGQEEIVLKCGESSITLTKAGKIIIRGKYLLNRSSGVNRIMGGSVQIN